MLTASGLKQVQGAKELLAIRNQLLALTGSSRFLCEQLILRASSRGKPCPRYSSV